MNYCEDLARSCEFFEFSHPFVSNDMLLRKIKQPLIKVQANYTGFSVSKTVFLAGNWKFKSSQFHAGSSQWSKQAFKPETPLTYKVE